MSNNSVDKGSDSDSSRGLDSTNSSEGLSSKNISSNDAFKDDAHKGSDASEDNEYVVALRVDPHHPAFAGHFPGRPIVPGVLLLDWALAALQDEYPALALPGELATVKFLKPVTPGAELRIVLRSDDFAAVNSIALRVECNGELVASATLRMGARR